MNWIACVFHPNPTPCLQSGRFLAAGIRTVVFCLVIVGSARAQFRLNIAEVAENAFDSMAESAEPQMVMEEVRNPLQQRGGRVRINRIVVGPHMDLFLFREHRSENATQGHLEQKLAMKISSLAQTEELTKVEKKKLRLAGLGDIALLIAEVNKFRAQFEGVQAQGPDAILMLRQFKPLQQKMAKDIFGAGSIFERVWVGMEDQEQQAKFQAAKLRVLRNFYGGAIKRALATVKRSLVLQPKQREQILEFMLADENMSKMNLSLSTNHEKHMVDFALFQLARQRVELAEILEDWQLDALDPMFEKAVAMEDTFRAEGYLR